MVGPVPSPSVSSEDISKGGMFVKFLFRTVRLVDDGADDIMIHPVDLEVVGLP